MKKTIFLTCLLLLSSAIYPYTWLPFCPESIHANNICFGVGSWKGVICSPDGMYLWEDDIEEWSFYTYGGLPVTGAAYLDGTRILVSMGNGSYSDGVYTFDLENHQFEVAEWIVNPNFLLLVPVMDGNTDTFTNEYYIGSQFGGLWKSVDGTNWSEVPFFIGKSCTAMDFYENHLVVTEVSNIYNIYWSNDYGVSWHEAVAGAPIITDLKFNYEGNLLGVFPDYSNSSGLYRSDDYGQSWSVEFWSDNMSSVGFDAMNTIFVGWESPSGGNEGIAIYDPNVPSPGLSFLNDGLPSTNINKILLNPSMSAIAIFCCTDQGVWMSYDYMVGEEQHHVDSDKVFIYPNPVSNEATIMINTSELTSENISISILNNQGQKVDEINMAGNNSEEIIIKWENGDLPAGVYYLVVKNNNEISTRKFILSK
ncbi:MAG: T9SS type A sorting domain-containing protein [Bacteroidales bacterium]|nr:T9SS type A sorting domain-containing protein [Bacteroidales bacterium]